MVKTFGDLFTEKVDFCLLTFNVYIPQLGYDIENKCNMVVYQQLLKNHTIIVFNDRKFGEQQKKIYDIYIRLLQKYGIYEKERQNNHFVMRNGYFFRHTLKPLNITQKFENFQDFVLEIANYRIVYKTSDKERRIHSYLSIFKRESVPKPQKEPIAYPDMFPTQKIRCLNANLGGGRLGADGQWNHGNNK